MLKHERHNHLKATFSRNFTLDNSVKIRYLTELLKKYLHSLFLKIRFPCKMLLKGSSVFDSFNVVVHQRFPSNTSRCSKSIKLIDTLIRGK